MGRSAARSRTAFLRHQAPRIARATTAIALAGFFLVVAQPSVSQVPEPAVSYVYDQAGRLVAVSDATSDTATYSYDEVGNLLSIARQSSTTVDVIEFAPELGPVGTTVRIQGTGFSSTASENTVEFNGTAATGTSATATELVVTVPSGATSGTISVTTPGGSAMSDGSFTVGTLAPSISSFTPTVADRGDTVTISGTNFSGQALKNNVSLGGTRAQVTSATATSVAATVPSVVASGRVVLVTPDGKSTGGDLYVPPVGRAAADVAVADRMSIGGTKAITLGSAGKFAIVLFDGDEGQRVSLDLTNWTIGGFTDVEIWTPSSEPLASTLAASGGARFIDTQKLPETGTYAIVLDPRDANTGGATLNLYDVPADSTGTITAGGSTASVSNTVPGENAARTFSGTAGERISLNVTNFSFGTGTACRAKVTIYKPDGSTLASNTCMLGNAFFDTMTLPTSGTYTIYVDPQEARTGSLDLTLYDVPADSTGTITAGGSTVTVATTVPGENAARTFSGTADERISLNVTNFSFGTGTACRVKLYIYKPDGSALASNTCMLGNAYFDTMTLPTSGTYTIYVDPQDARTGSLGLTLYDVPADSTGTITPGGSAVTVSNTVPGQNGTRTFSGTADQRISLNITNVNLGTGAACRVKVYIYKPDGSTLASNTCIITGAFIDTVTLPTSGTYSIFVDPQDARTGSVTLTLYDVPADDSGSLTIGGASSTMTLSTPGQNGTRTFSGTSGQAITLTLSSVTIGSSTSGSSVSIKKPDGSNLVNPTSFGTSGKTINTTLTATGTHTILIDPSGTNTGSVTLALTSSGGGGSPMAAARSLDPQVEDDSVLTSTSRARKAAVKRERVDQVAPLAALPDGIEAYRPPELETWTPTKADRKRAWVAERSATPWTELPPLQAPVGETALSGQVLALNGVPLAGVELSLEGHDGMDGDAMSARTDRSGRFLLTDVAAGHHVLVIDGTQATSAKRNYGLFEVGAAIDAGQTNVLPYTIWLPRIDEAHAVAISPSKETVVTTPRIPGLEVHIPAGSTVTDEDGEAVKRVSITPIPVDRPPFPLPVGVEVPIYFTIQPGGAYIDGAGAQIVYPNYRHEPPRLRMHFWHYNPHHSLAEHYTAGHGWYIYGNGTVTDDGRQVVPDPTTRIHEFTGAMISGGTDPPGDAPGPGDDEDRGDPVNLATGLFVMKKTDLVLPDALPLDVTRVYRPNDPNSYAFGIGTTLAADVRLWSDHNYQEADLVLPDGGRVHYVRTSPGTGFSDAVYESTSTPTAFYKSQLAWNGDGWDLTLRDGTVYVFGDLAPLQEIRDRYGNRITFTRSNPPYGPVTQLTASATGRWIKFTYDGSNRITQAEDNTGRAVSYEYDGSGRLWKVTDAGGGVTEYGYDSQNRMTSITDPREITYLANAYDANGRVSEQTQADQTTWQFDYTLDGNGKVTQTDVTDPRGKVERIAFTDGYTTSVTRALGTAEAQTTSYERDATSHLLTSTTDELDRETTYGYDSLGNLTSVTRLAGTADAVTTSMTYESAFNQLASVTDPLEHTTSFAYDSLGRLETVTDATGKETTLTANKRGQPLTITDPLEHTTELGYELGDLASTTDALGRTTTRFVDAGGRLLGVTDPLGNKTAYAYDDLNAETKTTDPLGNETSFDYDGNGNLLTLTDARGHETAYTYDDLDRVETRTDPLLREESYTYDEAGNLATFTDRRGQVTRYRYDALGRRTFAGFDETGAPGSETYASTIEYGYDDGNRLTSADDSEAGTITRAYDGLDRLTSETTPQGSVDYTFDDAGRRGSMTVAGEDAVTYAYDDADRLTEVAQGTATVSLAYDDAGRPSTTTLPNGIVEGYAYDEASQLTGLTYALGQATLGDLAYGYDLAGRRTGVTGSWARTGIPQAVTAASYDAANEVTSWDGTSLSYDSDGNLTGDGTNTYSWNARGELTGIAGSQSASFAYDALGRRIEKTIGTTTTGFLYDGLNVAQEQDGNGDPTANLLTGLGLDETYTRTDSSGTANFLTDALGSTISLADSSGSVTTTYTYEPFGKASSSGASSTNSFEFTGRENDGTGLYQLRARYYSPTMQQFLSEDPITLLPSEGGLYTYVGNSPARQTDRTGLCWEGLCWAEHAAEWAAKHPDVIVDAAAAGCIVVTAGTCTPVAYSAVLTTIVTSAYNNGLLDGRKNNWDRFATDTVIAAGTFGGGSLWGAFAKNELYIVSAGDRAALTRIGAGLFFLINIDVRGFRGDLGS